MPIIHVSEMYQTVDVIAVRLTPAITCPQKPREMNSLGAYSKGAGQVYCVVRQSHASKQGHGCLLFGQCALTFALGLCRLIV
jgi:hypothetical protein